MAFTVSTLGETWWLSAAISEVGRGGGGGDGRQGGGRSENVLMWQDMTRTLLLGSCQAKAPCFTRDKSITGHVHVQELHVLLELLAKQCNYTQLCSRLRQ